VSGREVRSARGDSLSGSMGGESSPAGVDPTVPNSVSNVGLCWLVSVVDCSLKSVIDPT
jgi:hypothetical protein